MVDEVKNTILIVDDEVTNINVLINLLWHDFTLYVAKDGKSAVDMALTHVPDLILLDIVMPNMDGYEVLEELRKIPATKNIPVIFITGLSSHEDEEKGLSLEVADYVSKPFIPTIVKLRIGNQIRLVNYLRIIERLSMTDVLTGLHNRRSFNERLRQEWGRAIRESSPLSLVILDIDNFKHYNDTYGHQQGDAVLQTVAQVFTNSLKRATDFVARWGGEEFTILLPSTNMEGALQVSEYIRGEVEQTEIILHDGTVTGVTVSAGVNELTLTNDDSIDRFISDTDRALYIAKGQGRNRVISAKEAFARK